MLRNRISTVLLLIAGIGSLLLYASVAAKADLQAFHTETRAIEQFFLHLGALVGLFLLAAFATSRAASSPSQPRWDYLLIFVLALAFRVVLFKQEPWLSNDIYRYAWDANVLDHGLNPYLHPPDSEALQSIRDEALFAKMSYHHSPSVYPPLLQGLFWLGRKLADWLRIDVVLGLKGVFVALDLALIATLFRLLPLLNIDPRWAILYAWHPLPVIEIAGNGHSDVAGALLTVLAAYALLSRREFLAAILGGMGFLIKFLSLLWVPLLASRAGKDFTWRRLWLLISIFLFIAVAPYAPFVGAQEHLWSGIVTYASKWRFNDGIFSLVYFPFHRFLPDAAVLYFMVPSDWVMTPDVLVTRRVDMALLLAKAVVVIAFALYYVRLWRRARQTERLNWPAALALILGMLFILMPTLHPWYLIWVIPVLVASWQKKSLDLSSESASHPNEFDARLRMGLLALSLTVLLSYWVLHNFAAMGVWKESTLVKFLEFIPPLAMMLIPSRRWGNRVRNVLF